MLVALDVRRQIRPSPIDAEPTKRRLVEQEIRPLPLEAVLQQPMREDDVDAGHLAAPDEQVFAKALAEERIVLTFDLAVFGSRTGRPGFTRAIQQFTHRFRVARPRPVP